MIRFIRSLLPLRPPPPLSFPPFFLNVGMLAPCSVVFFREVTRTATSSSRLKLY